jgi:hypothetical protein
MGAFSVSQSGGQNKTAYATKNQPFTPVPLKPGVNTCLHVRPGSIAM